MKKIALAATFAALATPALAGYSHHYGYKAHYAAPVHKVVCFDEKVFVPGYYGGHYVVKRICKTVTSYGY